MENDISILKYKAGDPSLIAYLQINLYQRQYRFKDIFEYYLMKGLADFLKNPSGSQIWVAEKNEKIVGSIAMVKLNGSCVQLRWFAVDEAVQGMGLGNTLMNTAIEFCKEMGYSKIILWTVDILHSARHLYKKHGFVLTETKENTEWTDHLLIEEKWEKIL